MLDKDGTLISPVSGETFPRNPEDQKLLPGVEPAIIHYKAHGWHISIASNQGGVAAGKKTIYDAIAEMQFALELLDLDSAYFCPDFEGMVCWHTTKNHCHKVSDNTAAKQFVGSFRKPSAGMLLHEKNWVEIVEGMKLSEFVFVGDRPEDEQAAQAAGATFIWAHDWRSQFGG